MVATRKTFHGTHNGPFSRPAKHCQSLISFGSGMEKCVWWMSPL